MLKGYLVVMLVGAFGCGARMFVSGYFFDKYGAHFPIGTLVVNVLGCLSIGILAALTRPGGWLLIPPLARDALIIGFLGGFTTFSSFALQTLALLETRQWGAASLNITLSLSLCLAAVWIGQSLTLSLMRH